RLARDQKGGPGARDLFARTASVVDRVALEQRDVFALEHAVARTSVDEHPQVVHGRSLLFAVAVFGSRPFPTVPGISGEGKRGGSRRLGLSRDRSSAKISSPWRLQRRPTRGFSHGKPGSG